MSKRFGWARTSTGMDIRTQKPRESMASSGRIKKLREQDSDMKTSTTTRREFMTGCVGLSLAMAAPAISSPVISAEVELIEWLPPECVWIWTGDGRVAILDWDSAKSLQISA